MRTLTLIVYSGMFLALATPAMAQEEQTARISYSLVEPSAFKDFDYRKEGTDETARLFDEKFQRRFVPAAEKVLPDGQQLVLRILDIDMAGEIQPWRNDRFEPIRYLEWQFPPKMTLEYRLLDPAGGVLAEGREELVDKSYDVRPRTASLEETFAFELDMLERWLKTFLAGRQRAAGR